MNKEERAQKFADGFRGAGSGMMEMLETAMLEGYPKALNMTPQEYVAQCTDGLTMTIPIQDRRAESKRLTDKGLSQREAAAVLGVDHATVNKDLKAGEDSPPSEGKPSKNGGKKQPAGEDSPPTETDEEVSHREGRKLFASDLYTVMSKAATFAESSIPYEHLESEKRIVQAKSLLKDARQGFAKIIDLLEEIPND